MPTLATVLIVLWVVVFGGLVAIPLLVAFRQARQDRRRILAEGTSAQAFITQIGSPTKEGRCTIEFRSQPQFAWNEISGKQSTTPAAIRALGLQVGSTVEVRFLEKWPTWGFIEALVSAERRVQADEPQSVFFVSFAPKNGMRWVGGGELSVDTRRIVFNALRARLFWFPKSVDLEVPLSAVTNVERLDNTVRLAINEVGRASRVVQFVAVNANQAKAIADLLPAEKAGDYAPELAERASFEASLLKLTPTTPVTYGLIGINIVMFLLAAALGGGVLVPNAEFMIKLGTDYTPLTLDGQWWRLLTSTFLHFGFAHVAFNMWALYVNGRLAERIFGSQRYLIIYLFAGISGSIASLLWHPIVNGAGASGAIFGVLGALIAFFVNRSGGVPQSVVKTSRNSVAIFVGYSLLNGARVQGIDNAAHLGGLVGGFVMGYLLTRPLDESRDSRSWTAQWVSALGLSGGVLIATLFAISHGIWSPRAIRDDRGNRIPVAGLVPVGSLGGVPLGISTDELLAEKGEPINRLKGGWVYNTLDSGHDAVITVYFAQKAKDQPMAAIVVEFEGADQDAAPRELPFWNGHRASDAIANYGEPVKTESRSQGIKTLLFRNGVYVSTRQDIVRSYGIVDLSRVPK